ncbi:hypothetical protein CFP56_029888 [Quercus suber]|uniref:Uncharacterized protein n=1 Tax=Quercus suber TaxID=58331 RepID=A0AAW0JRP4_QUESU
MEYKCSDAAGVSSSTLRDQNDLDLSRHVGSCNAQRDIDSSSLLAIVGAALRVAALRVGPLVLSILSQRDYWNNASIPEQSINPGLDLLKVKKLMDLGNRLSFEVHAREAAIGSAASIFASILKGKIIGVNSLPPPPNLSSRPLQLPPPPPLIHAQANPPFVNFPNLPYFFPPPQISFQQPCYWPSQFGQYIPHLTPTQPSLPPPNPNPPKPPPSSHSKPSPSHGERGNSAFFRIVSRPGKEVDAGGGRFAKPTGNPRNQVWKDINGHVKLGSDLDLEKQFPKPAGTLNQKEGFGGFDFIPKTNISTHLVSGRPMRVSTLKWTKAHFSLNIFVDFEGRSQRMVKWANFVQPKSVKDDITHTEFGNVKQANGGPIKQAQVDHIGDITHLKLQGLSLLCECGEGSGLQVSAEKSNIGFGMMEVEIPISDGGSDTAVQMGSVQMGCSSSGAEVGATSVVSGAGDPTMGCPISGAVVVSPVSSSGDHPRLTNVVAESPTVPVKRAEVSCHQPLLEQNRFSPISEMASNSFDEETRLLNWVNPMESDRDEEERQLMEFEPLAQWDPNGGLVLMTEEVDPVDISVEDNLEPSAWVSKKVKGFGKWVGFPIDSCERQCVEFFQRLEKVWEIQAAASSLRRLASSSIKGMRELWNLISTVNYDGQAGKRNREIVKFSGLGSDGCP